MDFQIITQFMKEAGCPVMNCENIRACCTYSGEGSKQSPCLLHSLPVRTRAFPMIGLERSQRKRDKRSSQDCFIQ